MGNNKIKLGLLAGLVIALAIVGIITTRTKSPEPYKATSTVDPDTGETLVTDSNQTENIGDDSFITLQGSDKLYDMMTSQQFTLLRDLIGEYTRGSVSGEVQAVKVLPDTIKINDTDTVATFQMKIDKPSTSLSATVSLYKTTAVRLVVKNTTKPGSADHDTGLVYVNQTPDGEYGGDGVPPEEQ